MLAPLITEIRSRMHYGLSQATIMLLMCMSCGKLWEDWKITRQLVMMESHMKSISLHLCDCLPWCQYYFIPTGKLKSTLMHIVIIPLLKCKSKDPADANNYRPIAITPALSKVVVQVLLSRLARYRWTADSQFGFKQAHGTEWPYFHSSKL